MGGEFFLLGTFLLGWTHPDDLLVRLSHDSIQVRERAADDLYGWGEELRGFLIDAAGATADEETRARVKGILRRLDADERIRWFGGGPRVAGFAASIRSDRFHGSGPFRITVEIMNLGPRDRELPGIVDWELDLPDQEVRTTGAQARLRLKKFIHTGGFRRTTWRTLSGGTEPPLQLRPGDCARFEYTLEARSLPPGDYDVSVEYFAPDRIEGAEENLKTNSVRLMIRK
jgi:hypothetical protein